MTVPQITNRFLLRCRNRSFQRRILAIEEMCAIRLKV